jgi:solute carrier family 29 (equilibrative nucleoside transporter), member 1/2/3
VYFDTKIASSGVKMQDSSKDLLRNSDDDKNPIDHRNIAFYIMLLEGLGNLFPWNAFITASSYFYNRFCGTSFQNDFENFFSISFTLSQTIGLAFAIMFADKTSFQTKIIYPLIYYATIFTITTALVLVTIEANLLFWLTLVSTCISGLLAASLTSGLFGLGAMFPSKYTGAIMTGQGLAGLAVSIASVVTTASTPSTADCSDDAADDSTECDNSTDYGAFAYFFISTLFLVACVVGYMILQRLPFTM